MIDSDAMRYEWHVVYRSADLADGDIQPVTLLEQDLVLWRDAGKVMAWLDLCIHRGARLSLGCIKNGELVCPYHGWRYNSDGDCTLIPAQPKDPIPSRAKAP